MEVKSLGIRGEDEDEFEEWEAEEMKTISFFLQTLDDIMALGVMSLGDDLRFLREGGRKCSYPRLVWQQPCRQNLLGEEETMKADKGAEEKQVSAKDAFESETNP